MSFITAVIPSWNTAAYLEGCLDSVAAQVGAHVETFVVDNGSTDASLDVIRRRHVPHIALTSNAGFAAAVNMGAARTNTPLVLVLNADCFLGPGCLAILAAELTADSRLGGVQPRIFQARAGSDSPCIYSTGQCLTRYGRPFERAWGEPDGPRHTSGGEVFGVSGAACLLRRELFSELGGYDARYFAFFEDVDLNARARLAGWRFAYVPSATATHVGHAGWRQEPDSQRFNVELTVRNRVATAVKVLPARGVLGAAVLTLRSILGSPRHRTTSAVLAGTLTALHWLPRLLAERKCLRRGPTQLLDDWLARTSGRGPDPGRV